MERLKQAVQARIQKLAFRLLGIDRLYAFAKRLPQGSPETFSSAFLDAMQMKVEWSGLALNDIPETGPLLVVANHPFGLVEGLALDAFLLQRRPDVCSIAWHMIAELPGIGERHIFIDPLRDPKNRARNVKAWRRAFETLSGGHVLTVFPAGQVARFNASRMAVVDRAWNPHIARLARKTGVPILPVYFHGHNGSCFQMASLVFPTLHQSLLFREVNNKSGTTLRATVGPLIAPDEIAHFATDQEAIDFLRNRTEALAATQS